METNLIILGLLFIFLVYTDIRNYLERKELLTRIMARDLTDFTEAEVRRVQSKKPPHIVQKGIEL